LNLDDAVGTVQAKYIGMNLAYRPKWGRVRVRVYIRKVNLAVAHGKWPLSELHHSSMLSLQKLSIAPASLLSSHHHLLEVPWLWNCCHNWLGEVTQLLLQLLQAVSNWRLNMTSSLADTHSWVHVTKLEDLTR